MKKISIFIFLIFIMFLQYNLQAKDLQVAKQLTSIIPSVLSVYSANYTSAKEKELFFKTDVAKGFQVSTGSGVIIKDDGTFITNSHVIQGRNIIKVVLSDGRLMKANVLSVNTDLDLALLKIEATGVKFNPIKIVSSKDILVGETIFAIGNPFGVGISLTSGIISALPHDKLSAKVSMGSLIQVDAPINPGSSGGALIDADGNLIGITSSIFSKTGSFVGIGFAIPSDVVSLFIKRSSAGKKINQYWLGFSAVNVTNEIAKKKGLEYPKGIILTQVFPGGPADKAKLKIGDIIINFDNNPVNKMAEISFLVASLEQATAKNIVIMRQNKKIETTITPSVPVETIPRSELTIEKGLFTGVTVANNSDAVNFEINGSSFENGVVVYRIDLNSFLYNLGIRRGDLIVSLNLKTVTDVKDLVTIMDSIKPRAPIKLLLKRGIDTIDITVS